MTRSAPAALRHFAATAARLHAPLLLGLSAALASLPLPGESRAQAGTDLPLAGHCHIIEDTTIAMVRGLAWTRDRGTVFRVDREFPARPVGLRAFGDGFKLSLLYDDPITGPSEAIVYSMNIGSGPEYMIGWVSHHILPDGTRLVGGIQAFQEAVCILE